MSKTCYFPHCECNMNVSNNYCEGTPKIEHYPVGTVVVYHGSVEDHCGGRFKIVDTPPAGQLRGYQLEPLHADYGILLNVDRDSITPEGDTP